MTTDLDTRLKQAAGSLRASVAPEPSTPAPRSSRVPVTVVALLTVVAMAAAAVALWPEGAADPHDPQDDPDVSTRGPVEVPRMLADSVPEGFELETTISWDGGDSSVGLEDDLVEDDLAQEFPDDFLEPETPTLYGDPDADNPYGRSDLVVATGGWGGWPDVAVLAHRGSAGEEPVTVRGHSGVACELDVCEGGPAWLVWEEEPAFEVSLRSWSFDLDQLLEVAEDLTIEAETVTLGELPDDAPGPLEEICPAGSRPATSGGQNNSAVYSPPGREYLEPKLAVGAAAGDFAELLCGLSPPLSDRYPVEVRGHEGWFVSHDEMGDCQAANGCTPASLVLTWEEAPGVLATVAATGTDLDDDDVLAVAESLREATDEEWDAAAAATAQPESPDPAEYGQYIPDDAVASVTTDGMGSAAYLLPDGQVCAYLVDAEGKLDDVCGPAEQRVHVLYDRAGNVHTLFGQVPEGTKEVAALHSDFAEPVMHAFLDGGIENPEGPFTLYALAVDLPIPEELRFSGDGGVIDTVPLDL